MYNAPKLRGSKYRNKISHRWGKKGTSIFSLTKWHTLALLRSWSSKLWDSELSGAGCSWLSADGSLVTSPSSLGGSSGSSPLSFSSLGLAPLPPLEIPWIRSGRASTPTRLKCSCHIVECPLHRPFNWYTCKQTEKQ